MAVQNKSVLEILLANQYGGHGVDFSVVPAGFTAGSRDSLAKSDWARSFFLRDSGCRSKILRVLGNGNGELYNGASQVSQGLQMFRFG